MRVGQGQVATLDAAKPVDDLKSKGQNLMERKIKAGEFYRQFHYALFSYISHRIPKNN